MSGVRCLSAAVRARAEDFRLACMRRSTESGVLQLAAGQYLAALIIGFVNSATIQPVIVIERNVLHRERAAGMYASFPYALAQVRADTRMACM